MPAYTDENPEYWGDYNNLQRVKHELLRRYLGGWFPILGSWSGRIVYIDCHAGRGKHTAGQVGSPLIALKTFLDHPWRDKLLKTSEVRFFFIEADEQNKIMLEKNLSEYKRPPKVFVDVKHGHFQEVLQKLIDQLRQKGATLAPAFVFVDPYGFTLPGNLLAQLKAFEKCELFITFMWRWVDMAIHNPTQKENMDALFVTSNWLNLLNIADPDERCEAAIRLLGQQIGGKYLTRIKMLGEHRETKYVLIHSTGHPKGREVMLDAIWKICPEGGFKARINDNPGQEFLIQPEPDLNPLIEWLRSKYSGHEVRCQEIENELITTIFLPKHLHEVIRQLRDQGQIQLSGYTGRFSFAQNPTISFNPKPLKGKE